MFVLTDGVPTDHLSPPRGIVPTLKRQLERMVKGDGLPGGDDVCVCVCVCVCECVRTYVCIYVYTYVCIYVYE
jgi:hypothetical protein